MKILSLCLLLFGTAGISLAQETLWINVLVHGVFGFQANASIKTIIQAKKDCLEETAYERNVLRMREHPYFSMIQPIQKTGFLPVKEVPGRLNAAYAFGVLFNEVQQLCGIREKNLFYTFGWSGLISNKRRYCEARILYEHLKAELQKFREKGVRTKIRLVGFSHGGNLLLHLADIRREEFPKDTFTIDEVYLVGMPVHKHMYQQVESPLFKKVYTIYSRSDKVQPADIFSNGPFSERTFKGRVPAKLTQIEVRITAPLKRSPYRCLPPPMRRMVNQSPGHTELWFFGWTQRNYRQSICLYPLPAATLIPYFVSVAHTCKSNNIQIALRPIEERACIRSLLNEEYSERPFLSKWQLAALIDKALTFHPSRPAYKERFVALQTSNEIKQYL